MLQVVDLLKDRDVGLEAANGFQLLLSDCSDLLTALDHANVKVVNMCACIMCTVFTT